ncbi:unnamed protein product [Caenorhabditis nigoni]
MRTNSHVILKILDNSNFEIDEISKTEQWRNSEELVIFDLPIFTNIRSLDVSNFQFLDVLVDTVSSDDVFHLKTVSFGCKMCANSPKMRQGTVVA